MKCEKIFIQNATSLDDQGNIKVVDRSGSCAHIVLIIEKRCYTANVGDSRTIMSGHFGEKVYTLSRDHRPNDEKEYERILVAGGKIYQTEANISNCHNVMGPLRVLPGKLSVSRTIGDIEAKDPRFGGNPQVVIPIPEIKYFEINATNDFIIIGCDGVYEKLKNKEIVEYIWKTIKLPENEKVFDIHNFNGILVQSLIDYCLKKNSTDNLTCVMISLKSNFLNKEDYLETDYVSQTTQPNKIPKVIKNENTLKETSKQNSTNQILSKIIKSSNTKTNVQEKFMNLNK
jgi:protein phosphatase 2C family protein 2/3